MAAVDTALVHALAMHHVEQIQKSHRRRDFPYRWRQETIDRLSQAIEQAIEQEVDGIEREIPD